jgi:hypothetical protein
MVKTITQISFISIKGKALEFKNSQVQKVDIVVLNKLKGNNSSVDRFG